jgi:16S rRNA processing protein RimM
LIESEELVIALVRGPVGVNGDLAVASCSGETAHFAAFKAFTLRLAGKRFELGVEWMEEGPQGLLVHFAGYDNPERAASLTGAEIVAPREKAAPLGKGQYYSIDISGCELQYEGKSVGRVLSVIEGGAYDFLECALPNGQTSCVPFLNEFIGDVDLAARTIELKKQWILE